MQRVDAGGVSGAEVTTQGDRNIVVSIPEIPTQEVARRDQQVLAAAVPPGAAPSAAGAPQPAATPSPSGTATGSPSPSPLRQDADHGEQRLADEQQRGARRPDGADPVAERLRVRALAERRRRPAPRPRDPTDLAWITPEVQQAVRRTSTAATRHGARRASSTTRPSRWSPATSTAAAKYILGPVAVSGDKISNATSGYQSNQQGNVTSEVEIAPDPQR